LPRALRLRYPLRVRQRPASRSPLLTTALILCALVLVVVLIAAGAGVAMLVCLISCLCILTALPNPRRIRSFDPAPASFRGASPRAPPLA
jgi:hypothetical protein